MPSENPRPVAGSPAPLVALGYLVEKSAPPQFAFSCPWCRQVHSHGAAGGAGIRGAHCGNRRSPMFGHGVRIVLAGSVPKFTSLPHLSRRQFLNIATAFDGGAAVLRTAAPPIIPNS